MKKLRELLSDTLIYGISSVLARFVNYLMVPLHTKEYSEAQYGIVGLVYAAIVFLNVIFTFGMESAYLRYAKDRENAGDVFKTLQIGLLLLATGLSLIIWLASPVLMPLMSLTPETKVIFYLMIGILWFDTLSIVPFAELRLIRKSYLFASLRMVHVFINLGLNFYLILELNWGIEAVFVANLAASVVTALPLWITTAWLLGGGWRRDIMMKAFRFGFPFVPAGIGYAVNEILDRFFLNNYMSRDTVTQLYGASYTSEDIVGIYNACYKLAMAMMLIVQMFRMAWQPFFLRHSDDPEAKNLYRDAFRYFNVAAGVVFLTVALFAEQIVAIRIPVLDAYVIGENFWMGLHIVPVLLGAYWFHGWYMNFSAGIFIEEETKVLPVITLIGAGITIAVNLMLIPYFGMMGSAVATLISYASMAILLYRKSIAVYPVSYDMLRAFLMIIIAAVCLLAQPWVNSWFESEWISRILLLFIGMAGFILCAVPPRLLSNKTA